MLLFLSNSLLVFGQDKTEELIDWSATRRLAWNDYKSNPDPGSDAAASTTTYLGIEYNFSQNTVTYKIACRFSPTKSWGLHKTDYILSHEQGHFDIAEIFARKLNKKMNEYQFDRKTYQKDLKNIYQEIIDEKEEWQNSYDEETNHSIRRGKQAEWLKKIEQELDEYKGFADYQGKFPAQQTLGASIKVKEKTIKPNPAKRRSN